MNLGAWRKEMLKSYSKWVASAPSTRPNGRPLRSAASGSSGAPANASNETTAEPKAPLLFERRFIIDHLMYLKSPKYIQRVKNTPFNPREADDLLRKICRHVEWTFEDCEREYYDVFGGEYAPPAIVTARAPPPRSNQATANAVTADEGRSRGGNKNGDKGKGNGRNGHRSGKGKGSKSEGTNKSEGTDAEKNSSQ